MSQAAIDAAEALMLDRTGYDAQGNIDSRDISLASVETAWSIVATRVHTAIVSGGAAVVSESETDYSYTIDRADVIRSRDMFYGLVADLLRLSAATWSHRHTVGIAAHPFWDDLDQQAPGFVDALEPTVMSGRYPII